MTSGLARPSTPAAGLDFIVPEEVAVAAVDDEEINLDLCSPPLSALSPNPEGIGYWSGRGLEGPFMVCGKRPASIAHCGWIQSWSSLVSQRT